MGDPIQYFTAPAGTFEAGATGWTLTKASVVTGNETAYINGTGQTKSLKINAGGTGRTPVFCNKLGQGLFRFFSKGNAGAKIHVHVDVTRLTNRSGTVDVDIPITSSGWAASAWVGLPYMSSGDDPAGTSDNVQITFTAVGGPVQIDDVEIDPWKSV